MERKTHWTLVTGGAKRIGAEICLNLAKQGYPILVHYNQSQKEAVDIRDQCRDFGVESEVIQGDFSSRQSTRDFIDRLTAQYTDIQNVIHNVGNYLITPVLSTAEWDWIDLFQTNLFAPMAITQAVIGSIKEKQGNIINLGITGIEHVPVDTYAPAYTATKLSLWMMTKTLAKELAPSGVRVNMVSPGYTTSSVDIPSDLCVLPMKRAATLHEIARVVAFLLDKESSYITGQNIEVAGGTRLS